MLLAIDKPSGITSYDVIRRLKRVFPKQKIGHSGTLDPLATGLLIIGIGQGTKSLHHLQGLDKSYETCIDLSQSSDTRDVDHREYIEKYEISEIDGQKGIIKNDIFVPAPTQLEIEEKLKLLIPEFDLPLSPFSAKKKDGKKFYELARSGQIVTENRIMKTYEIVVVSYEFPFLKLNIKVGSGTYIRSIGYWIGLQFGLGGILKELRRTVVGKFEMGKMNLQKLENSELMTSEIEI